MRYEKGEPSSLFKTRTAKAFQSSNIKDCSFYETKSDAIHSSLKCPSEIPGYSFQKQHLADSGQDVKLKRATIDTTRADACLQKLRSRKPEDPEFSAGTNSSEHRRGRARRGSQGGDSVDRRVSQNSLSGDCESIGAQLREIRGQLTKYGSYQSHRMEEPVTVAGCKTDCARESYRDSSERQRNSFQHTVPSWSGEFESKRARREALSEKVENTFSEGNCGSSKYRETPCRLDNHSNCLKVTETCDRSQNSAKAENVSQDSRISNSSRVHIETSRNDFTRSPERGHKSSVNHDEHGQFARNSNNKYSDAHSHSRLQVDRSRKFLDSTANLSSRETSENTNEDPNVSTRGHNCMRANQDKGSSSYQNPSQLAVKSLPQCTAADPAVSIDKVESRDKHPWKQASTEKSIGLREPTSLRQKNPQHDDRSWQDSRSSQLSEVNTTWNKHYFTDIAFSESGRKVCPERQEADAVKWKASFIHESDSCKEKENAVIRSQNWAERGEGRVSLYPDTHDYPERTQSVSMNSDIDTVFEGLRSGASRGKGSSKDKSHKPSDKSKWAYEVYSSTSQKEEVLGDYSRDQRKSHLAYAQKSENVCSEAKFDHKEPNKDWQQNEKYLCGYSTKVEADMKYKFYERHYQEVEKRQACNTEIPKSTQAFKEPGSNDKEASAVGEGKQTYMNIGLHREQEIDGIKDSADDSPIREDLVLTPLKPRSIMTLEAAPTEHAILQTCSHENTKPYHDIIFDDPEFVVQLSTDNLFSSRGLENQYKTRDSEVSSRGYNIAEINQSTTIEEEKSQHGEECKNLDSLNRFISPGDNSPYFNLENQSPRQTANSVDETLMKTVYSIKEDIESVLLMLNTIEEKETKSAFTCQRSSPPVEPLNSNTDPVANVTCAAADIVKRAFTKLVSFKNTLSVDDSDEELNSLSYGEYKKGKEAYVASELAEEDDYNIETIFSYRDGMNGSRLKALNQQKFERRNRERFEQNFGAQGFKIDTERCTGRKESLGETSDRVTSRWPPKSVPVSNLLNPNLAEEFSYYMSKQTAEGVVLPSDNYVKGRNKTRVYSTTGTPKDRSKKSYIDRSTRNSLLESVSGYLQHGQRDHHGESKPRARMEAAHRKKKKSSSTLRRKFESGSGTAKRYPIPTLLDGNGTLINQVFRDDELDQSDQEIESYTRTGSLSSPESSPRMSGLRRKNLHSKEVIINVSETTVHRRVNRSTDSESDNSVRISRMSPIPSPNKTDSINSRNKNKTDIKKKDDSNKKGDSKNKGDGKSKSDSKNKGYSRKIDLKKGADSTQRKPGQRGGSNHSLKDSAKAVLKNSSRPRIVKKIYTRTPTPSSLRSSKALRSVSRYTSESDDNLAKSATSSEDVVVKTQADSRSTQTLTKAGPDVGAKFQTPRPVTSSIGIDTHQSSLGTKRASGRKRRSSRTQSRSKDGTHVQIADHYKMSSSDTSLFKKSRRSSRGQAKKAKNHQLQKEPVSYYEHSMDEMLIGSGFLRPPRSYDSRSHPEVVITEKQDRHIPSVEKAKYQGYEEADLSENTDISDISEHTSPLEDHKKFISANYKEKDRALTKKQETKYAPLSVEESNILRQPLLEDSHIRRMLIKDDKMPQERGQNPSPQADISSSELNTSMKKLYEEITKLRLQLETSADEMSARPLPNLSRQEDVYRSVRSYKAVSAPSAGSTAASPMDSNQFMNVFPNIDGTIREMAFAGSQMKSATMANLYKTISNSQEAASGVANGGTSKLFAVPEETDEKRATVVASHEHYSHHEQHDVVNYPQSTWRQQAQAQPCGDYTEFAPGEQNRDSERREQPRKARRGRSDRARYWPNDDVNAMATSGLSDTTDTQNDCTDKFETAVSEEDSSTQYFSHDASDSSRPLRPLTARTNVTPCLKTQVSISVISERNETSSELKRGERTTAGSGFKNVNASGGKSPLAVHGSHENPSEQKTVTNADQGSINNNMKSSDSDIWPVGQNNAAFRDTATRSHSYLYPKTGEFQIPGNDQIPANIKSGGQNYCHTRQFLQPEYRGLKNLDRVVQLCSQSWLSQLSCPNYFPAASELNSIGAPLSASAVLELTDPARGSPGSKRIQPARSCCPSAPRYQTAETDNPNSVYFESKHDDRQAGDSVYTTRFPFIMKYAQDMFIGSVDAQIKESRSRNPKSYLSPRKGSPKRQANSPHLKRSKTSLGNSSAVEDASVGEYCRAPQATNSRHGLESSPVIESSPVMANYLSNRGQTLRSGFLSKSFGNGTDYRRQRDASLLDNELKWGRRGQDCRNCMCDEAVVSCGLNSKNGLSVPPEMLSSSTRAQHPVQPCPQACTPIEETDKVMNHYSDAISARLRKNLTYRRSSDDAVSREHYAHPDRSAAYLKHSGLSEKTTAEKPKGLFDSPSSSKKNEPQKVLQLESGKNQNLTTPKTHLEDPDPNDIIASFENMMQQKRPYYVEHCGSRLKKQDGDVPARVCVGEPSDGLGILKPKFQMVTVANDNNSSIELKQIAASVHSEDDCSGRQAYLEDDTEETITDTLVSSCHLSKTHTDHWLEELDHGQKCISEKASNDDLAKSVDCAHADENSLADSLYHGPLFNQDSIHEVAYDGDPASDSEGGYNVPDGEIPEDRLVDDTMGEEDDTQNESVSKSSDGSNDGDAWNKPAEDDESELVNTEKMGDNDDDLVSDLDEDGGDEDANDVDDNDVGSEEDDDEGGAEEYFDQKEAESSEFEDQSSSQQAVCFGQV